jgi:hypothetical protein
MATTATPTAAFTFKDLSDAVAGYPALSVTLTIEDLTVTNGTTGSVNVNEVWKFKVKVKNNGDLNMTNVKVHVEAQNKAKVSTNPSAGVWKDELDDIGGITHYRVDAGESFKTNDIYFQAPSKDSNNKTIDLVRVSIADWDADLTYILTNRAGQADPPSATYPAVVYP